MTLFKRSFTVNRSAVGVPQSKTMSKLLSPYVSLVLFTSAFCGRTSQTILEYAISFHLTSGTSDLLMKNIVLVPLFLPGMIRWQYSKSSPVSSSRTAFANSVKHFAENFRRAAWWAVTLHSVPSNVVKICCVLNCVRCYGPPSGVTIPGAPPELLSGYIISRPPGNTSKPLQPSAPALCFSSATL